VTQYKQVSFGFQRLRNGCRTTYHKFVIAWMIYFLDFYDSSYINETWM